MDKLFEETNGWTFLPARLQLEPGIWKAEAGHEDGRSLVAESRDGPLHVEQAIRDMAEVNFPTLPNPQLLS